MMRSISTIIKEWKDEAGVKDIILVSVSSSCTRTIKICTSRPGPMIGLGGELFDKYKAKLKVVNQNLEHIEFIETDSWYIK